MRRTEKTSRFLLLFTLALWAVAIPAASFELETEYTIPLEETDRVMGSLEGNFMVYGRPKITLYHARGNPIFTKQVTNNVKPIMSPNGKYIGLVTYADKSPTDLKTLKLEMYDQAGKLQWQVAKPAPNTFFIANNGAIFGVEGVEGIPPTRIYLFDPYGNLRNILTYQDYRRLLISPMGSKLIIDRGQGGLDVYDSLGNMLMALPVSTDYIFDRDERYIATFYQGICRIYQDEKEVQAIRSSEVDIREMAINVASNLLVLMAAKRLEVFELVSGKLLWEFPIKESSPWLASLDVSKDGKLIVCGVDINRGNAYAKEERHVEGNLFVFSADGKMMVQHHETYKIWLPGLPRGVVSPSGGSIMVETKEKLLKLRIK
jgi:hypothetical protein